ncbi:queuine tRNA-ribosyltransferase [Exophiala viscosa]|uniref:Queuine tRNA-ribosyltransferase accessory subunit 2 n=1 Tax=Exophiala viscosa TaxID=2486360 RepID=A0AAN6IFK6_9EURO|nr:queuine tRNA-ribosyltransferase [Exophiala viscosa]KAI1619236.1 queuine tRNA-ribosyltransferase [Exophiala viscosa]
MEDATGAPVAPAPGEMFKFVLQKHASASETAARIGQLALHSRPSINTPNYIVPTSRGVIPHLSQDNLQKHTRISAVYVPLEDFIEKSHTDAPIYTTPVQDGNSPLRRYIGLPDQCLSVLGPRRVPNIIPPAHNTNSSLAISTSVGFRFLELEQYNEAVKALKADVAASMADLIAKEDASQKRIARSIDRTHAWLRDSIQNREEDSTPFLASIPPLELQLLSLYLADIRDEYRRHISGLCIYSPMTMAGLPDDLRRLPTICLSDPASPQALLSAIHAGIDLITVPFVTQSSEHGIALSFSFPGPTEGPNAPLGTDLWSPVHATDLSPLSPNCKCYSCTRHHRAYVHHLLQANEMLAWTLLQIHNYTIIDSFFEDIRQSIQQGTFDTDVETFNRAFEPEIPKQTGQGPRVRGYQMKSVGGGESRKNPKAYGKLDDQVQKLAEAESGVATPDGDANDIAEHGLASKIS